MHVVSIPFIAGQWSLPPQAGGVVSGKRSLNPLHCGAVVASPLAVWRAWQEAAGLNPLHCGAVVASGRHLAAAAHVCRGLNPLHCGAVVASVQMRVRRGVAYQGLNPLHCGAVVASGRLGAGRAARAHVSIPFIAGQWSLPSDLRSATRGQGGSQSPSLRGSGRFPAAEAVAALIRFVSIPFIAGQWSLRRGALDSERRAAGVSIPFIAGQWSLPGATL